MQQRVFIIISYIYFSILNILYLLNFKYVNELLNFQIRPYKEKIRLIDKR